MAKKAHLTPEEQIKVAHFHINVGWKQHEIAAFMDVNPGRVAEAIRAVKQAVGHCNERPTRPDDAAVVKAV